MDSLESTAAGEARRRAVLGVCALLLLAMLSNRLTDFDLWLSARFAAGTAGFAWREHWLTAGVLHAGARWLSTALAAGLLLAWLAGWRSGSTVLRRARLPIGVTLLSALAAALAVALLKQASRHSCPWDLQAFGGRFEFFRLLAALPANPGPGQCLPSGHASTGFMWIGAVYAAARWPRATPWARWPAWRGAGLLLAAVSALAQVVRGAHFLSHVLIGVAVCWAMAWAVDAACGLAPALRSLRLRLQGAGARPAFRTAPGTAPALAARAAPHRAARRRPGAAGPRP